MKRLILLALLLVALPGVAASEPIEIEDWHDLDDVRENPDADYVLVNDLNQSTDGYEELASETADDGSGWQPISTFVGSIDGNGNAISGLNINRPGMQRVGLVQEFGGTIENLHINGESSGGQDVGLLVGFNSGGDIIRASSDGFVQGDGIVGGLVGANSGGDIIRASSDGFVQGDGIVGGLVGALVEGGAATDISSSAVVSGGVAVGGVLGLNNDGDLSRAFATGDVSGNDGVGAVIGSHQGSADTLYWNVDVFGAAIGEDGGQTTDITGLTTEEMQGDSAAETMSLLDFEGTWTTVDGDYPTLLPPTDTDNGEDDHQEADGLVDWLSNADIIEMLSFTYGNAIPLNFFIGVVCSAMLASIWINSRSISLVAIVSMLSGGVIVGFLPAEVRMAGYMVIVVGVAATLVAMYTGQRQPVRR